MSFPAAHFSLESAEQNGIASIRIRFTQDPRRLGDGALTDALTTGNYTLVGPALNYVTGASAVFEDPQAVDLFTAAPILTGTWSVSVVNAKSDTDTSLVTPTAVTFVTKSLFHQEPLSGGAKNDSTKSLVRKFLNPGLKGPGWNAFVSAVAAGDRLVHNNARLAFDQIFLSSASERYLERRAADRGVTKPHNVGMLDEDFRELSIVQANRKVVPEAVLEILEVFYGEEALRAYTTAEVYEPYTLNDNDDLTLVFDGTQEYTIHFIKSDFGRISMASAVEVSSVISRQLEELGSQAYASAFFDKTTGKTFVRVYSGRRGVGSSVQVIGGRGQLGLVFPQSIFPTLSPQSRVWSATPVQSRIRFSITIPSGDALDFSLLHEGDVAYLYGLQFPDELQGSYEVKAVGVTYAAVPTPPAQAWFEIENPEGSAYLSSGATSTWTLTSDKDLTFFRPVRRTVYGDLRRVTVSQQSGRLGITMPATSQLVSRAGNAAAYISEGRESPIVGVWRVGTSASFTTSTPHGLSVGDLIDVSGIVGSDAAPVVPATPPGVLGTYPSTVHGQSDTCKMSRASTMDVLPIEGAVACPWGDGYALVIGGKRSGADVTAPSFLMISGETPEDNFFQYIWNATTATDVRGQWPRAIPLSDGTIFSYGGKKVDNTATTGTLYSRDINRVVSATHVSGPPLVDVSLAQSGNKAYVFGGLMLIGGSILDTIFEFPLGGDGITGCGNMVQARGAAVACTLPNGKILIAGGYNHVMEVQSHCELFDPSTNEVSATGAMTSPRMMATAVALPGGFVLVLGGANKSFQFVRSCDLYNSATGRWTAVAEMPMDLPLAGPLVAIYQASNNAVYVPFADGSIWYLDVSTLTWHMSCATGTSFSSAVCGCRVKDRVFFLSHYEAGAKGSFVVTSEEQFNSDGLNERLQVTYVGSSNSFSATVAGSGTFFSSTQTAKGVTTKTSSNGQGPYTFDPSCGFTVTSTVRTTDQILNEATSYSTLQLSGSQPALDFPDTEGWLVFSFGDDLQVGPVKYFGRLGDSALRIDASFKFPVTLPLGTTVTYAYRTSYTRTECAFWLTDSAAGRQAAIAALDETVACGVDMDLNVEYPDDQGLGNAGCPVSGAPKLADKVWIWGGDEIDADLEKARDK